MNALPFRIKIGVTGKRENLPAIPLLKNKIWQGLGIDEWNLDKTVANNSIFSLFQNESPAQLKKAKNTPIAFSILSALAEGADRIVAEVILETRNAKLEVVLPLAKEDYLTDFKTATSKFEFEQFLKKDPFAIALRNKNIEDEYSESNRSEARRKAYFQGGKYIVDHCDVLIVLWDGVEAAGKGGTFDVMKYAEKNGRPYILIDSTDPDKEVKLVKGNGIHAEAIAHIDHFNTMEVPLQTINAYKENVFKEYFNEKDFAWSKNFNPRVLTVLKENLFPYYAKASLLATSYKNRYKWTGQLAYIFSTVAVIILFTSIVFDYNTLLAFILEFFLLLFIFSIITLAQKGRVHSGWLEYRFLVERIRACPYFFLAGKEVSGVMTSSNSSPKAIKGQWAVMVFSEIWHQLYSKYQKKVDAQKENPFNPDLIPYVQKSLIKGQIGFQEKYFKRNNRKNDFLERGGRIIFFMAILAALVHIILSYMYHDLPRFHLLHQILTVLALSLPTIAAAFEGVRRQSEYSRNKNRSEAMKANLEELDNKFESAEGEEEFYKLLREADITMLSETKEWMMLMVPSELEYIC